MKDYGNLVFEGVAADDPIKQLKNVRSVGSANQRLSEAVQAVKRDGHTCVMLGGDHRCVCVCEKDDTVKPHQRPLQAETSQC